MKIAKLIAGLAGLAGLAACSTTPMIGSGPAACRGGVLTTPDLSAEVGFETEAMCMSYGGAYNRALSGATDAKTRQRAAVVNWLEDNFVASEQIMIDRFARAQLFRCGEDPDGDYPKMQPGLKFGDGEEECEVYMTIILPPAAEQCQG